MRQPTMAATAVRCHGKPGGWGERPRAVLGRAPERWTISRRSRRRRGRRDLGVLPGWLVREDLVLVRLRSAASPFVARVRPALALVARGLATGHAGRRVVVVRVGRHGLIGDEDPPNDRPGDPRSWSPRPFRRVPLRHVWAC